MQKTILIGLRYPKLQPKNLLTAHEMSTLIINTSRKHEMLFQIIRYIFFLSYAIVCSEHIN